MINSCQIELFKPSGDLFIYLKQNIAMSVFFQYCAALVCMLYTIACRSTQVIVCECLWWSPLSLRPSTFLFFFNVTFPQGFMSICCIIRFSSRLFQLHHVFSLSRYPFIFWLTFCLIIIPSSLCISFIFFSFSGSLDNW